MATNYETDTFTDLPARFSIDSSRPLEVIAHNRNGEITVRGVQRNDILVRVTSADGDDDVESLRIVYADNRLEVRTDHRGPGRAAHREARRAAREASRAAREASRAAREVSRATQDIFRRREGSFGKGGILGSWQIDFDDHVKHELRDLFPFGRGGSVDLVIEIPVSGVEARVEAHTTSGEIRIEEVHGAVDSATASGEIFLSRVSGDLTVQTASGEITLVEPTGSLRARSASGDLNVREGTLEQYVLNTASGDISLATTLIGAGPYRIDAVSGDVNLILDAPGHILDRGCTIPFNTVSGDLAVSGVARKINRRTWHYGPETDNGIEIAIRTVSGDATVTLTRRPDGPATTRAASPDDATRPIPTEQPANAAQTDHPVPPVPPTPPAPAVPPIPPTPAAPPVPPTPPAPITAAAPETASGTTESEPQGDALSRLAEEMEATLKGEPISTYSYPPGGSSQTAPPSSPDDARLDVLAALERGEIDIDEAMRRLDSASAGG